MHQDVPMVPVHFCQDILTEIELVQSQLFKEKHTFQVLKKLQLHNTTHELSLIVGGVFPLYMPS